MADRQEPTVELAAIEYRGPYTFVRVRVSWDDGESDVGAGNITLELPIDRAAADHPERLRQAAIDLVRRAVALDTLRPWRGRPR